MASDKADGEIAAQLDEFDELISSGAICISSDSESEVDDVIDLDNIDLESLPPSPVIGAKRKSTSTDEVPCVESVRQRRATVELPFPDGAVRLTRMVGQKENLAEAMTLSDILQKGKLRKALLSTYVLDLDWLLRHFDSSTKLVIVKSYDPKVEQRGVHQSEGGRITLVNPEFTNQTYPMMHSKVMLLFYDDYVRFVVSSANLFDIDWTVLQNIVFIQDMPYTSEAVSSGFAEELAGSLRDISVPEAVVERLNFVDCSRVKVHIVTSVPTAAGRSQFHADSYGLDRLSKVAKMMRDPELDESESYDTKLYCYGSSMGRLTSAYLRNFYARAMGSTPVNIQSSGGLSTSDMERNVKVGFHTQAQGLGNVHGSTPRQCIKFKADFYSNPPFPRYALHRVESKVANTLIHAKVILARSNATNKGQRKPGERGWIYLGSHNFTPGAWGHVQRGPDKRCNINNYEFGVILPSVHFESMFGRDTVTWNGTRVPLPFRLAWSEYEKGDIPLLSE
ncbi:hypothetical protein GGI10_000710 [Coemansia sp. RSA 2530]|nr:hypothetical protein GGI06_000145 [Coemansia sp. S85]KAJ2416763.1 hypothetical protein GGI10_000710 [Coemansia sp. RSA 2530]